MTEENIEYFDLTRNFVHPNLKNYVRNSRAWNIIPCGKKVLDYFQDSGWWDPLSLWRFWTIFWVIPNWAEGMEFLKKLFLYEWNSGQFLSSKLDPPVIKILFCLEENQILMESNWQLSRVQFHKPQTSDLSGTFFATRYNKPALVVMIC